MRAAVKAVRFALLDALLFAPEPAGELVFDGKVFCVFRIALRGILGEHAEIAVNEACEGEHPERGSHISGEEHGQDEDHEGGDGEKARELIGAIAPRHEPHQPISHTKNLTLIELVCFTW